MFSNGEGPMPSAVEWEATIVLLVAVKDELLGILSAPRTPGIRNSPARDKDIISVLYIRESKVLLRVLLAKLPDPSQGGDAAACLATRLVERYKPYCLATVGLCAGDPKQVAFGDVVVASATVRHDFGKLEKKRTQPLPTFTHRREPIKVAPALGTRLLAFLRKRYRAAAETSKTNDARSRYRVALGTISTGNQVVRVTGLFSYLNSEIAHGLQGDEHDRNVIALDMEAHAIAYAAKCSNVPLWLVVKGVSDYADSKKGDRYRISAMRNAYSVAMALFRNVIVDVFLVENDREVALIEERRANDCFRRGDISGTSDAAEQSHRLGRRSSVVRRRLLHSLTYAGEYLVAARQLLEYRDSGEFYDEVAIEVEATALWRQGRYRDASLLLSDRVVAGRRQLMYLRAMTDVFLAEAAGRPSSIKLRSEGSRQVRSARRRLEKALAIDTDAGRSPWWIEVNLLWVLRLERGTGTEVEAVFARAQRSVELAISEAPARGSPRLYLLLLLAIAGKRTAFEEAVRSAPSHLPLSLELVDMVYERLAILGRKGVLGEYEVYWAGICSWLRRLHQVGRPVRDTTSAALRR